MSTRFVVLRAKCVATLAAPQLKEKIMAVRKKSETIHLRVKPISKALLEGLANSTGKTSTQIIEDLITEAAANFFIEDVEDIVNDGALKNRQLDLETALVSAHCDDDPLLTKLRTFYIAPNALSARDKIIASAVAQSSNTFFGKSELFSIEDEIIKKDYISKTPKLDLHEVSRRMPSLEDFAVFREKNQNFKSTYEAFLKMIGEE